MNSSDGQVGIQGRPARRGRPILHIFSPAVEFNGGIHDLVALTRRLRPHRRLVLWCLSTKMHPQIRRLLEPQVDEIRVCWPIPPIPGQDHVLFYMNEYAAYFDNAADALRETLSSAATVQIVINLMIGGVFRYHWLADNLSAVYFLNRDAQSQWGLLVRGTALAAVSTVIFPPPVELDEFLTVRRPDPGDRPVIGWFSGYVKLPPASEDFYRDLAERLPEAEFRFLPGPDELTGALADHPRFHFLEKYSLAPARFLSQVDVLCIPVRRDWPTMQGPRCLIEAMAAGVPAVMVDRDGPRDRIAHGQTGFATNDLAQMANYVVQLVDDVDLRRQFGLAARARARQWKVEHWVDALLKHSGG